MSKKKEKRRAIVPKTIEEVIELLTSISQHQRDIDAIEAKLNKQIAEFKLAAAEEAKPHFEAIDDTLGGIYLYSEANRETLTEGGKTKSVKTPIGIFGWRTNPPSIEIKSGTKLETIIERIRAARLGGRFIRWKPELNREAMLEKPEMAVSIKGIKIRQDEIFYVKFATEVAVPKGENEIERVIEKLRKTYAA